MYVHAFQWQEELGWLHAPRSQHLSPVQPSVRCGHASPLGVINAVVSAVSAVLSLGRVITRVLFRASVIGHRTCHGPWPCSHHAAMHVVIGRAQRQWPQHTILYAYVICVWYM